MGVYDEMMGLMVKWLVDYFDNSVLGIIFDIVV